MHYGDYSYFNCTRPSTRLSRSRPAPGPVYYRPPAHSLSLGCRRVDDVVPQALRGQATGPGEGGAPCERVHARWRAAQAGPVDIEDLRADVTASFASKYCVAVFDIFTVRGTCGSRAACPSTCTRQAASETVGPFLLQQRLSLGSAGKVGLVAPPPPVVSSLICPARDRTSHSAFAWTMGGRSQSTRRL